MGYNSTDPFVSLSDPSGQSILERRSGAASVSDDAGLSWSPLGGAGLPALAAAEARAYLKLPASQMWFYSHHFIDSSGWTVLPVGTGNQGSGVGLQDSADAVNAMGGVLDMQTNIATDSGVRVAMPDFSFLRPTISYNDNTKKFYRFARFRLVSAADATTILRIGSFNWSMGVNGSGSAAKYSLRLNNGGTYIVSTVNIDNGWHLARHFYDGVNAFFGVDNEPLQGVAAAGQWPLTANQSFGEIAMLNSGNTNVQRGQVSFVAYAGAQP